MACRLHRIVDERHDRPIIYKPDELTPGNKELADILLRVDQLKRTASQKFEAAAVGHSHCLGINWETGRTHEIKRHFCPGYNLHPLLRSNRPSTNEWVERVAGWKTIPPGSPDGQFEVGQLLKEPDPFRIQTPHKRDL